MIAFAACLAASLNYALPVVYVIDCKSLFPGTRAEVEMTAIAADGSKLVVPFELGGGSSPEGLQDLLVIPLRNQKFGFHRGPNTTVIVTGPMGQPMRSLSFKSDGWVPKHSVAIIPPPRVP